MDWTGGMSCLQTLSTTTTGGMDCCCQRRRRRRFYRAVERLGGYFFLGFMCGKRTIEETLRTKSTKQSGIPKTKDRGCMALLWVVLPKNASYLNAVLLLMRGLFNGDTRRGTSCCGLVWALCPSQVLTRKST